MNSSNKTRTIAFRVTEEEWRQIEAVAGSGGHDANEWARALVVERAMRSDGMTRNERLLYEELARVRYLLSHGFGLLANDHLTSPSWEKVKTTADQKPAEIADALLARRPQGGQQS
jgi:Mobilization protein NikA